MKTIRLDIRGMTCDDCARTVERAIRSVPGVGDTRASYRDASGQARVQGPVTEAEVVAAVENAGYGARVARALEASPAGPADTAPADGGNGLEFDLLIVGTGAAGMAAAIRGAELGRRVAIVESGTVGGTCVNVGCIPSKNLLAAAERFHEARLGSQGVEGCYPPLDWTRVQSVKDGLVGSLRQGKYLDVLASYPEVTLLTGRARLRGSGDVDVGGVVHRADKVVLATGTSPWAPRVPGIEDIEVQDSTSVMELEAVPASMIVLGGSAVGLELGQLFSRLGTRVTVIELMPRILPGEDEDASEALRRALEEEGMEIHTGANATRVETGGPGVVVHVETGRGAQRFEAERLLAATGRRANTEGLALEKNGVAVDERGFVRVDEGMRTSNPHVFAAGDVTGRPGFVYLAAAGGRVAADNALGEGGGVLDLRAVPRVTFTSPQIAAVGRTPAEATAEGLDVEVSRLGLEHVPRALVEHRAEGWIQIVAAKGSGRILGVQAVGTNAAELLGEATLAVRLGLTTRDLTDTLHPYLTWSEGLKLAAQAFRMDVSKLSCCA